MVWIIEHEISRQTAEGATWYYRLLQQPAVNVRKQRNAKKGTSEYKVARTFWI